MKKGITAAGAVLLAAVVLTACGRDGAVSSEKAVSSAVSAEAASSEATAALPSESSAESLPEASAATSSKAASSKKPASSAAIKPSKPNLPAKPADLIDAPAYMVSIEAKDNWYLDASGALYNFTGEKRICPFDKEYQYNAAKQVDSNIALCRSYTTLYYKIDKKGTLYAKGTLPKDNAQKSELYTDTELPFINSHMYEEKTGKRSWTTPRTSSTALSWTKKETCMFMAR